MMTDELNISSYIDGLNNKLHNCKECCGKFTCDTKGGPYIKEIKKIDIMFIAQNPGASNLKLKKSYPSDIASFGMDNPKGRYHKFFDLFNEKIPKLNFYITNIIKCVTVNNEVPHEIQINNCKKYLDEEISFFEPTLIISLGRIANIYFDIVHEKIKLKKFNNVEIPMVGTYHPGYMNRKGGKFTKQCFENILRRVGL